MTSKESTPIKPLGTNEILVIGSEDEDQALKEHKTNSVYRFFANSLPGRAVESTVRTVFNTGRVSCLSPWGDNNPVILPTIRARDIVLLGVDLGTGGATGVADAAGVLGPTTAFFLSDTIAGAAVAQITNDVVSQKLLEDPAGKLLDAQDIRSLPLKTERIMVMVISIKHKLHNVNASMGFYKSHPTHEISKREKAGNKVKTIIQTQQEQAIGLLSPSGGWYSAYLMSTHRLPAIPRTENPAIVMCYGPFLPGDYLLAHHLVASIPHLIPISCPPDPSVSLENDRMLITLVGIRPLRGSHWTSSRRPDEGKLRFVLANGIPGIILEVKRGCPLVSWMATTLSDAFHLEGGEAKWIELGRQRLLPFIREVSLSNHEVTEEAVLALLKACWELKGNKEAKKEIDSERAGIVFMRYGNREAFESKSSKGNKKLWDWRKKVVEEDSEQRLEQGKGGE